MPRVPPSKSHSMIQELIIIEKRMFIKGDKPKKKCFYLRAQKSSTSGHLCILCMTYTRKKSNVHVPSKEISYPMFTDSEKDSKQKSLPRTILLQIILTNFKVYFRLFHIQIHVVLKDFPLFRDSIQKNDCLNIKIQKY